MPLQLPPTYVLKTHFERDQKELHRLEKEIGDAIVWDIRNAKIAVGRVTQKERAKYDLQILGLKTEEVTVEERLGDEDQQRPIFSTPRRKRRKVEKTLRDGKKIISLDSSTESESSAEEHDASVAKSPSRPGLRHKSPSQVGTKSPVTDRISVHQKGSISKETIRVLNINWYTESLRLGKVLPMKPPHLVYEGRIIRDEKPTPDRKSARWSGTTSIARVRASTPPPSQNSVSKFGSRKSPNSQTRTKPSQLIHQDTSDHDAEENMPPLPAHCALRWSCQRRTPIHSPNDAFISQLKIIRDARELDSGHGHEWSKKSYSGAIAAIQSYPYTITSLKELMRLPGCGKKVGDIWNEWKEYGQIQEIKDIEKDERLNSLRLFYGIHQVGESTAKQFYDVYGWRTLDDIMEYGWDKLKRDQQIGLKYYDELALRIPRAEVKATGDVILRYANSIAPGFKICIVGGYRRGKPDSGDMDFILSHPDQDATQDFLESLLNALGVDHGDGWITHELTTSTKNSERGQETRAWRTIEKGTVKRRSGFDTLDHAFVVWRDPNFEGDVNPNVHRRVDIIVSPWKTAGCAVLGWSGGTQFERDLRSYCREEKNWKFDSSGIRDLETGNWMDLENKGGYMEDILLEQKEKWVFEGLGLEYIEPTERCTH